MNLIKFFRSKIYLAESMVAFVLLIGVLGYRFLADFSWMDAIYMTVITVTTVGFSEVKPLDPEAKIFTVFLIIASVFIFAFAISVDYGIHFEQKLVATPKKEKSER